MILGSIIIDMAVALVMVLSAQIAIPSEGKKCIKWQALASFSMYIIFEVLYYYKYDKNTGDTALFIAGAICEVSLIYVLVWIGLKGNFWRNVIVLLLTTTVANMLASAIVTGTSFLADAYYKYSEYEYSVAITDAILIFFIFIITTLVVAFIFRKIFTFNYRKNGKIYKIIAIIYNIMVIVVSIFRKIMDANGYINSNKTLYASYVVALLFVSIVPFNLLGAVYNRIENKRVLEEQQTLRSMIKTSTLQYIKLTASNEKLKEINESANVRLDALVKNADEGKKAYIEELTENIKLASLMVCDSVTGDLYVDIALSEHAKKYEKENIMFESTVDSSAFDNHRGMEMSAFVNCILDIADSYAGTIDKERMIVLSIRKMLNAVIIKAEFSKAAGEKVNKRIINKKIGKMDYKLLKKAIQLYCPKLIVDDEESLGKVSMVVDGLEEL